VNRGALAENSQHMARLQREIGKATGFGPLEEAAEAE
jgi:hypothetical protein